MARIRYEVHGEQPDDALIDELAAGHRRLGIAGLLRAPGQSARPGRVPAPAAVEGFRWGLVDQWSRRWWPQGIEVLAGHGARDDDVLLVSWFAQQRRGTTQGARISVVDRRDPRRPRYHHVLLVEPVRAGSGIRMRPVDIHAGGLAVVGDRLSVAATYGGLRTFRLGDILCLRGRGPFGYRHVLPQSGHQRLRGGDNDGAGDTRMRFSFVSVERGSEGGADHLVVGEFGPESNGRRLGRIPLAPASQRAEVIDLHEPGIPRMQGAAVIDGTWFVSASQGVMPGDLWVGSGGTWVRHPAVLPPGPEDLTASHDGRRLWSLSEYPRQRWVFAMDAAHWRKAAAS
ncbi:MAG TPA: hypothetical protein VFQ74_06860 [Pseudolysinimonas sp.]|nr:hypothetical protein [Pseudolysinimonas sp.]